jgi:hypothetical protein
MPANKTITIQARITPEEKRALEREALALGMTLSELIRVKSTNNLQHSFGLMTETLAKKVVGILSEETAKGRFEREEADRKLIQDLTKLLH